MVHNVSRAPAKVPGNKSKSKKKRANARARLLPIADAYLFTNVCGATLRSLGWFAGLFFAFILVNAARKVAQDGMPLALALEGLALQLPRLVLFTLPASLLLGTVSTFTEMSAKGELTALMSGGMSLWRMLRAPLALATAFAVFAFWLQDSIVPEAEIRNSNVLARAAQGYKGALSIETRRQDGTIERIVEARVFDAASRTLSFPVIQLRRPNGTNEFQIQAEKAAWDARRGLWTFTNGKTQIYPTDKGSITTPFEQLDIKTDIAPEPETFKKAARSARDHLDKKNFEMVTLGQVRAYRGELQARYDALGSQTTPVSGAERRDLRRDIRSMTFGLHDKLAFPLVIIALVLVGMPLGVRPQRTAAPGVAMGLSLLAIMGYYFVWMLCQQWAKGGGVAPVFVAYLPALLLALIGTVLIVRRS